MDEPQDWYFPIKNYSSTKSSLQQQVGCDLVCCAWNVALLGEHHPSPVSARLCGSQPWGLWWDPHLSFCTRWEPAQSQHPAFKDASVCCGGEKRCVKTKLLHKTGHFLLQQTTHLLQCFFIYFAKCLCTRESGWKDPREMNTAKETERGSGNPFHRGNSNQKESKEISHS